jgi:hypothetical protein
MTTNTPPTSQNTGAADSRESRIREVTESDYAGNDTTPMLPSTNHPLDSSPPSQICRSNHINKGRFMSTKFEDEIFLSDVVKGIDPLSYLGQLVHVVSLQTCPSTGYLDTLDPRVYLARRTSGLLHNPDSPKN